MTSESSEPDEQADADLAWHREMDRLVDAWDDDGEFLPGVAKLLASADIFDDEPTHEKWRRGQRWN